MIRNKRLLTFALALSASVTLAAPPDGQAPPPPPGQGGDQAGQGPRQGERRPVPPVVAALDLDGNGIISAAEIDKAPESLKKLDKNGDGQLTPDELRPPRRDGQGPGGPGDNNNQRGPGRDGQGGQGGQGGPRDGDGGRKGPRDGQGGKGPGQDASPAAKPNDAPDGGPGKGDGQQGNRQGGRRPMSPLMAALDADGDGVISADEIAGAAVSLRKLDKNGDSQLTPDEHQPPRRGDRDGQQGGGPKGKRDGDNNNNNTAGGGDAKKRPPVEQ